MKLFMGCLLLVVPFLASCKGELAGVSMNLAADGSGDCEVSGIRGIELKTGESGNPDGLLQDAQDVRTIDLQLRQIRAKFKSVNDLKIGDLTFALEKKDAMSVLTVKIPAGSNSKWFGAFGVTEEALKLCQRLEEESRKEEAARRKADPKAAGSQVDLPEPSTVAFVMNLPGVIEGQSFETEPLGVTSKIGLDKGERAATLTVPLVDIHANKMKEIVWRIRFAAP